MKKIVLLQIIFMFIVMSCNKSYECEKITKTIINDSDYLKNIYIDSLGEGKFINKFYENIPDTINYIIKNLKNNYILVNEGISLLDSIPLSTIKIYNHSKDFGINFIYIYFREKWYLYRIIIFPDYK